MYNPPLPYHNNNNNNQYNNINNNQFQQQQYRNNNSIYQNNNTMNHHRLHYSGTQPQQSSSSTNNTNPLVHQYPVSSSLPPYLNEQSHSLDYKHHQLQSSKSLINNTIQSNNSHQFTSFPNGKNYVDYDKYNNNNRLVPSSSLLSSLSTSSNIWSTDKSVDLGNPLVPSSFTSFTTPNLPSINSNHQDGPSSLPNLLNLGLNNNNNSLDIYNNKNILGVPLSSMEPNRAKEIATAAVMYLPRSN